MLIRRLFRIRDDRQGLQNGSQVALARGPVFSGGPFHSMPQLGNGNRGDLKSVVGTGSHPLLEVEGALLAPNDDVGVENYRHRLRGALSLLRAVRKSRRHVLASFSGKPVLERASAKSRPAHTFSPSGTRRANGSPFFRSTNVTFW